MTDTVEFLGAKFRPGDRVGLMPMMRYARVTKRLMEREKSGAVPDGTDEIELFDATLSLLEQCVHPDDWDRFERHSTERGAGQQEFMEFAGRVMSALSDRPTGRSSDSSDGPRTIEPSSTAVSSSPEGLPEHTQRVIDRLNGQGQHHAALMVRERAEAS